MVFGSPWVSSSSNYVVLGPISCVDFVTAVVSKVGKLLDYWNMPLFSISAIDHHLRDPWNYGTLVRVSTPSDRYATALVMFCQHNNVTSLDSFGSVDFRSAVDLYLCRGEIRERR